MCRAETNATKCYIMTTKIVKLFAEQPGCWVQTIRLPHWIGGYSEIGRKFEPLERFLGAGQVFPRRPYVARPALQISRMAGV
jgi:hypothetical protein